jgi:hypothetical protein
LSRPPAPTINYFSPPADSTLDAAVIGREFLQCLYTLL